MKYLYPITVIDDFLDDPDTIVKWAKNLEYNYNPYHVYPGKRTNNLMEINKDFCYEVTQKVLNIFYENPSQNYEARMYFDIIERGKYEEGWVHQDDGNLSFLIYLNKTYKTNSGTSIYKKSSSIPFLPSNNSLLQIKSKDYKEKIISKEGREARNKWNSSYEKILQINPLYNRIAIYPSSQPHSADILDIGINEDRFILVGIIKHLSVSNTPLERINSFAHSL